MKISVLGLGYVGVVTAALIAQKHQVIGVDISKRKVQMVNEGVSPILEDHVDDLVEQAVSTGALTATLDVEYAIKETDASIICVGTPSHADGSHDLTHVHIVVGQLRDAIRKKGARHDVILRSTVPAGTTERLLEEYFSDLDVGICFNPEFLREGVAVKDYLDPPFIIAACSDEHVKKTLRSMYAGIEAETYFIDYALAETIKIICNVYHALKVTFANEVGRICGAYGIDAKRMMEIFCQDTKLNLSEKYLAPGFAYGGSCLPKDLRSLQFLGRSKHLDLPLISSIGASNDAHIRHAISQIEREGKKKLGFIGLSFKAGTDDLRESPYVQVVEHFIGKGYDIKIFDSDLILSKLMGTNKDYIEKEIHHIDELLVDSINDLEDREVLVVNKSVTAGIPDRRIIDLR